MNTLNNTIDLIIENNYDDIKIKDKQILKTIIQHEILKQPFFKNDKTNSNYIVMDENGLIEIILFNEKKQKILDLENYPIYDDEYKPKIKSLEFKKSFYKIFTTKLVIELFNELHQVIKSADNIYDYKQRFDQAFIESENDDNDENIQFREDYYNMIEIIKRYSPCYEFENFLSLSCYMDSYTLKHIDFTKNKPIFIKEINEISNMLLNKDELLKQYDQDIEEILKDVETHHPIIFKDNELNKDDITFKLLEIDPSDTYNSIPSESSHFNDSLLNKYNIERVNIKDERAKIIFEKHPLDIWDEIPNINFYGFKYLDYSFTHNEYSGRRTFLISMKNNEVLGIILFSSSKDNMKSGFYESEATCIKHNYRNLGLSKIMYEKMDNLFNDLKLIFINSEYSDMGLERIRHNKEKINEKSNLFYMDKDCRLEKITDHHYLNCFFYDLIGELDKKNKVLGYSDIFKKIYNKNILLSIELSQEDYSFNIQSLFSNIKKEINNEIKKKQAKKIKPKF